MAVEAHMVWCTIEYLANPIDDNQLKARHTCTTDTARFMLSKILNVRRIPLLKPKQVRSRQGSGATQEISVMQCGVIVCRPRSWNTQVEAWCEEWFFPYQYHWTYVLNNLGMLCFEEVDIHVFCHGHLRSGVIIRFALNSLSKFVPSPSSRSCFGKG